MAKPARTTRGAKTASEGFWDKPSLMNFVSDLLMLGGAVCLGWAALHAFQRLPLFPLRQVVVQGSLQQVTRMQVDYAVRGAVSGNFFTVNLDGVRTAFEKLPWVRRAEVRRIWPDTLELTIEEQVAAARWRQRDGEYRLVNRFGEVFSAATEDRLPEFSGPEGAAAEMLAQFQSFSETLRPIARHPTALSLSPREAWQVRLDDGLVVELGREESKHPVAERLGRFVALYPEVRRMMGGQAGMIDMRYPNGFALRATRTVDKVPQT